MHLLVVQRVNVDTATTEIYTDANTLSLHDALPIFNIDPLDHKQVHAMVYDIMNDTQRKNRSEEHTSELQ